MAIYRGEVDAVAKLTRRSSAGGASSDHAAAAFAAAASKAAAAGAAAAGVAREKLVPDGGMGRRIRVPDVEGASLRAAVVEAKWRRKHAELLAAVG